MDIGGPGLRVARAALFAVVCVLASLAMHLLAGGSPVHLPLIGAATVSTGCVAFALARRRLSGAALLGFCFLFQYGMHHLFALGAVTPPADHHTGGAAATLGMAVAHGVVAVLSAAWLSRGESALAELLHLLVARLLVLLRPRVPAVGPVVFRRAAEAVPDGRFLTSVLRRRGPPVQPAR
ncbi:hypothetical protein FDA94_27315 [Herbidospora galbida]|uniref:Uncharacterized protein n=1 Tax=Herbidospora galbida TaxID=2575442 RepID=A0A4U3M8D5_9ACTN|nr:hypothetical protein [Herbidospora galbida]TKK85131.1 hypothetical protein FDA94_27315 [Herbidospora galbida]